MYEIKKRVRGFHCILSNAPRHFWEEFVTAILTQIQPFACKKAILVWLPIKAKKSSVILLALTFGISALVVKFYICDFFDKYCMSRYHRYNEEDKNGFQDVTDEFPPMPVKSTIAGKHHLKK